MIINYLTKVSDVTTQENNIQKYLETCMKHAEETDYFYKQGFTLKTIQHCRLGFDPEKNVAVFPYSSALDCYQTWDVVENRYINTNFEPTTTKPLFNQQGLWASKKHPVFITDTLFSALSIIQCHGNAIALCDTDDVDKLIEIITLKRPTSTLIIALSSKKDTKKIETASKQLKIAHTVYPMENIHQLLINAPEELVNKVQVAIQTAKEKCNRGMNSISAYDLQQSSIAPPEWIISNMLPCGLAILCAGPKVGKSWMALQLCIAASRGNPFLGYATTATDCLYLALEDSFYRLKDRMNKILSKKTAPNNFYLATKAEGLDGALIQQLDDEISEHPNIKLVVIDTLQKVRGATKKNESAYATDYREIGRLKSYADDQKICILLIHHLRKTPDEHDIYNMISGSNGIMGVADTIFVLSKKHNEDQGVLSMTGRDIQQDELIICFNKETYLWENQGTIESVREAQYRELYNSNPVVQTIRTLLSNTQSWEGTASDLLEEIVKATGNLYCEKASAVGKEITKFEAALQEFDNIHHWMRRSNRQKIHIFKHP